MPGIINFNSHYISSSSTSTGNKNPLNLRRCRIIGRPHCERPAAERSMMKVMSSRKTISRWKALATAGVMRPTQRGLGELLKCCPRPVKALDSDYRARVILSYCYCTLGKSMESHIIRYFVPIPTTCEHTLNRHRFTRGVKSVPVAPNSDGRSQKTPSLCYLRTELALTHTVKAQWKSESLHFRASPHHVV